MKKTYLTTYFINLKKLKKKKEITVKKLLLEF